MRSRFLEELPESALKWITPRRSGFGDLPPALSGRGGLQPAWGRSAIYPEMLGASAEPARPPDATQGIVAGRRVFHNKFGEGQVLAVEGAGADARAQVDFPRHGVKWLALAVAKLTLIE